jgi:hypothetical protein
MGMMVVLPTYIPECPNPEAPDPIYFVTVRHPAAPRARAPLPLQPPQLPVAPAAAPRGPSCDSSVGGGAGGAQQASEPLSVLEAPLGVLSACSTSPPDSGAALPSAQLASADGSVPSGGSAGKAGVPPASAGAARPPAGAAGSGGDAPTSDGSLADSSRSSGWFSSASHRHSWAKKRGEAALDGLKLGPAIAAGSYGRWVSGGRGGAASASEWGPRGRGGGRGDSVEHAGSLPEWQLARLKTHLAHAAHLPLSPPAQRVQGQVLGHARGREDPGG